MRCSASGAFAQAGGLLLVAVKGLDGNVHLVQLGAQQSEEGIFGGGHVDSFSCPEGGSEPFDEETGELFCEPVGFTELWSESVILTTGKKMVSAYIPACSTSCGGSATSMRRSAGRSS